MTNKLIHYNNKLNFETDKDSITDHSLVFILDSEEIYTHSEIYKGISWSVLSETSELSTGVYAVNINGELIDYNTADSSCIGVALVAGEHKFMIAKADATDDKNTMFYWTKKVSDLSLTNYGNADGINGFGYLSSASTPQLNKDFTTWTAGALSDFNGKANTDIIKAVSSDASDMCTVLNTFNASNSFKDWYVPAIGLLALVYLNITEINEALVKIGGTALTNGNYWSSTEYSVSRAWTVTFLYGCVSNYGDKDSGSQVRFVRDLKNIITFTIDDNAYQAEEGMTWKEWVNSSYNSESGEGVKLFAVSNQRIGFVYNRGYYVHETGTTNGDYINCEDLIEAKSYYSLYDRK